jgi:hypothetical protein
MVGNRGALKLAISRAAAIGVALVAAGLVSSSAAAQSQRGFFDFFSDLLKGTPEEEAACKPDVTKYCQDAVPDTFRVLGCLKQQRRRLSKPCLAVLESHGQ